jgi:hypothetical protein
METKPLPHSGYVALGAQGKLARLRLGEPAGVALLVDLATDTGLRCIGHCFHSLVVKATGRAVPAAPAHLYYRPPVDRHSLFDPRSFKDRLYRLCASSMLRSCRTRSSAFPADCSAICCTRPRGLPPPPGRQNRSGHPGETSRSGGRRASGDRGTGRETSRAVDTSRRDDHNSRQGRVKI